MASGVAAGTSGRGKSVTWSRADAPRIAAVEREPTFSSRRVTLPHAPTSWKHQQVEPPCYILLPRLQGQMMVMLQFAGASAAMLPQVIIRYDASDHVLPYSAIERHQP